MKFAVIALCAGLCLPALAETPKFPQPTPEELAMTNLSELPGAPAVVLLHDEETDDDSRTWTVTMSIKILTEAGRDKYSNVVIPYGASHWEGFDNHVNGILIEDIAARVVQPDGSIVPFTGKADDHLVTKGGGTHTQEKIFSLSDVRVGSIVQYRFTRKFHWFLDQGRVFVPDWTLQTELFIRKAHFYWRTGFDNVSYHSTVLPDVGAVKRKHSALHQQNEYTLDASNVMPIADESYMPPKSMYEQRVDFFVLYYPAKDAAEYWRKSGNDWNDGAQEFIGLPIELSKQAASIVAGATGQEEKLRKLYAAVQNMANVDYLPQHSDREDKEVDESKSASEIWKLQRGTERRLTLLFVGLARAAGMKASLMTVVNRDHDIFSSLLTSYDQFDDHVAIVEVNGKEQFFDPGVKFCPYGQLAWIHTSVGGLRQTGDGSALVRTPAGTFRDTHVERNADLKLDEGGSESGVLIFTMTGAPAMRWRQASLTKDSEELRKALEDDLTSDFPVGTEAKTTDIQNLTDYEKPLIIRMNVSGPMGVSTAKRVILPEQFFEVDKKPEFVTATRNLPVYFDYPERVTDTISVSLPASWQLLPQAPVNYLMPNVSAYQASTAMSQGRLMVHRDFLLNVLIVNPPEYSPLKTYFDKIDVSDQMKLVLQK